MAGDPLPTMENLYRGRCIADIHLFMDQLVGDTVVVPFQLKVIVDVDSGFLPLGKDIP